MESRSGRAMGFQPYVVGETACWYPRTFRDRNLERLRAPFRKRPGLEPGGDPVPNGNQLWMSMQYGFSMRRIAEVVAAIQASNFAASNSARLVEIKFLKGDYSSYLGPNADGDAVLFNLWWLVDREEAPHVFDPFERLMRGLGGKPHWGKLHRSPDRSYLKDHYPHWPAFEAVRARLDPGGRFAAL